MRSENSDLHGSAPDKSEFILLIVDVINDLDFPEANKLARFIPRMARNLARLKKRATGKNQRFALCRAQRTS